MNISRRNACWVIVASAMLLVGTCGVLFFRDPPAKQIVGDLLRLPRVPTSLRNAECESWGLTDVLTTCIFEIDPAEFPETLKGWRFERECAGNGSFSYAGGPRLGSEFPVAVAFGITDPPLFPHGGHVFLVADASRSRAQVDYYEE